MIKRIFLFILLLVIFSKPVLAVDHKFSVSSDSTYKISENGMTTMVQNFGFTNLTSQYFPSEFIINLPFKDVYNLRAFDKTGALHIETSLVNNSRQVKVTFGEQVVGQGSVYNWTLAFETPEVAKKSGRIWEIFAPKPAVIEGNSEFTVGLYVPESFGKKVYSKPAPSADEHIWKSSDFKGAGIFAAYDPTGSAQTYQAYDFNLIYHLYNPKLYPVTVEIALPPDTARQKIFLNELSPRPLNVRQDADGNWLAKYQLSPTARQEVKARGSIAVFLDNHFEVFSETALQNLKTSQKYWEPVDQNFSSPLEIYQFVVSTLHYDRTKSKARVRLGSKDVLKNPLAASCLEFSDLFIAIARSSGIPAREIEGFAMTSHQDIQPLDYLHAWPEYYDVQTKNWAPVDPTWGRTTNGADFFNVFDFNHIAFAIHGQNSSVPAPAGTYKLSGQTNKDIEITYHEGDLDFTAIPKLGIRTDVPTSITSGFSSTAKLFVENYGPTSFIGETAVMNSDLYTFFSPSFSTGAMLPFSKKTLEFNIEPLPWNDDQNDIITLQFGRENRTFNVASRPFYRNNFILTVSIVFALGVLSIIAQITRSLFVSRHSREGHLRGKG